MSAEESAPPSPSGSDEKPPEKARGLLRFLDRIANIGNKLPDPITLFVILAGVVVLLSAIFAGLSDEVAKKDGTVELMTVKSLLSGEGIRWMLENMITNFTGFAPLGSVLAVMLGIGVAERSNLIAMGLKILVESVPKSLITSAVVFGGVMSSMAADAGYVVLVPLGAVIFASIGRHPLVGLAAAYAGVSGGFSANLIITGLDPLLQGLTEEAAQQLDPSYTVNVTCNLYFMIVSTVLITVVGTAVTTYVVEPMLGTWDKSKATGNLPEHRAIDAGEKRAFWLSMLALAVSTVLVSLLVVLPDAPLTTEIGPDDAPIAKYSPFFESIEVLIALLFFIPGVVYGVLTKQIKSDRDVAKMTSDTMSTMGAYIVLAFAAAQFVAFFNWSSLGPIVAVKGANGLEAVGFTGLPLILAFLVVSMTMNLFIGSASAKWAFMAPIFVPLMMQLGYSPELVQATYRVGDSITNIITPLMPYLPIIIVFAQKYDRDAGLGTIIAAMLPYSIAFGIAWTIMLGIWIAGGFPLGPGAGLYYAVGGG